MTRAVSIVIPTYRRVERLLACLDALAEQDYPTGRFEIVVADDECSPDTCQRVRRWAGRRGQRLRYVPVLAAHGPAAARNAGWQAADGRYLAFTDDDCLPDRGWLRAGIAALEAGADAAYGPVRVPLPPHPTDYQRDAANLERAGFVTANAFCRREALLRVGGFDERFTAAWREDSDLHFALVEAGCRVERVPEARVVHPLRPARWGASLAQQAKTRFNALLYKKHPRLYRQRVGKTAWRYYLIVGSLLAAVASVVCGRTLLAWTCLGVWLLATADFCRARLRGNAKTPSHVAEMIVTSLVIPWLSLFWRCFGAVRYRTWFW